MRVTLREDGTGTIDYLRSGWRVELPPPDTFRWTLARDEFELVFDVPGEYVRSLSYRVRRRGANRLEVVPIAMNGEIVDDAADDSGEMWRVNSR